MISIQNWFSQGTGIEPRWKPDAGLVIYDKEAAQYFETIFLRDWANLTAALGE